MKLRKIILFSVSYKIAVIGLCLLLLYAPLIIGKLMWFNNRIRSESELKAALDQTLTIDETDNEGLTGLMYAASTGDQQLIRLILERGANVNLTTGAQKGNTALFFAIFNGWVQGGIHSSDKLLEAYSFVRVKNIEGDTPLHMVALILSENTIRQVIIERLLMYGADINAQNDLGKTLAHAFVERHDSRWMKIFIDKFGWLVDWNVKENRGFTPYQLAQYLVFTDTIAIMDINRVNEYSSYDPLGLTPLIRAIMRNNMPEIDRYANQLWINTSTTNNYAQTPLHMAVLWANEPAVKLLLERGAQLKQNWIGETPLHAALRIPDPTTRSRIMKLLLDRYAAQGINLRSKKGQTLLHGLIQANDQELFDYVINKYGNILNYRVEDINRRTPLTMAEYMLRNQMANKIKLQMRF